MNCRPPGVMMTCTSAPALTSPRTTSAALYAAIPPVTPRAIRGPPRPASAPRTSESSARLPPAATPPIARPFRPSGSRLTVLQARAVGGVGLRRHFGDFLDGVLLGEGTVAVGNDAGDHLLHRDGHRLVRHRLDPRTGPPLQLPAAFARHGDEFELVADVLGGDHRTSMGRNCKDVPGLILDEKRLLDRVEDARFRESGAPDCSYEEGQPRQGGER